MHERPRRSLPDLVAVAYRRCSGRLARRTGTLLFAALTLGLAAAAAAVVPGLVRPGIAAVPPSVATLDAAARKALQTGQQATSHRAAPPTTAATASRRGIPHGDHRRAEQAAAAATTEKNANCSLQVPADPLSAQGLATPYQLVATDRGAGACHEADSDQSAFVEAAIYDSTEHTVSIYHPLVVDEGDRPAVPPTPVSLPAGSTVGIWFGFNGDGLTLAGDGAGKCVNGLRGSIFGQFAYCGADAFFAKVNADPTLPGTIPALGTARDGKACPTTRDFLVVDQDQSDNLATAYRVIDGRMAQVTPQTRHKGTALTNGSDEGLLAKAIDPALGCTAWTGTDLNNPGTPTAALALNELSAAKWQDDPKALVPTTDPMVLVDDRQSEEKTNLYRAGVDMGPINVALETGRAYCAGIQAQAPARLVANSGRFAVAASPTPDQPNLLAFLQARLTGTLDKLGCTPKQTDQAGSVTADRSTSDQPTIDRPTADRTAADTATPDPATTKKPTTRKPTTGQAATGQATTDPAAMNSAAPSTGGRRPTTSPPAGAIPAGTIPAGSTPAGSTTTGTTTTGTTPAGTTPAGTGTGVPPG